MKLPARLAGLVVGADGRPLGLDLPSLDQRGAAEAWRAALGRGPFYVHFSDRDREPALERVQRIARLGEVWLDCPIHSVEAALDLLIAGAARLVVPGRDADLLDAVSDSAVVAWDGSWPIEDAIAAAAPHEVPIVAMVPLPVNDDPGLFQAPPKPWTGPFEIRLVNPAPEGPDAVDEAGEDEGAEAMRELRGDL